MKISCYPADSTGCGQFRIIKASEALIAQGHDIDLRPPTKRDLKLKISGDKGDPTAFVEDDHDHPCEGHRGGGRRR